jgi:hypothetical protein
LQAAPGEDSFGTGLLMTVADTKIFGKLIKQSSLKNNLQKL